MKMKNLVCVWVMMLVSLFCKADPLDKFVDSLQEQEKVSKWVGETAKGNPSATYAKSIVSDVYAHSYSKGLNPVLVLAVAKVESDFVSNAKSSYGAKGIMQVVPRFHKTKLAGRNPYNTAVSVEVGTTVLQECFDKHNKNVYRSLSCYSGGAKKYYSKVLKQQYEIVQSTKPKGELLAIHIP